jgi:hypothetical protein
MRSMLAVMGGLMVLATLLYGCGQASSSVEKQEKNRGNRGAEQANKAEASQPAPEPTTQPSASSEGGITVGKAIAEAELRPVGDSGTRGTAVFKEVGNLGIQVELDVLGLPTKDPNATYYAQVHEGSCSEERTGEGHEEEHDASSFVLPLALVRFDHLLAKGSGLEAHGGHEPGIPEVPPGRIDQPISFGASANGTVSVSTLLEGVAPERLTSGGPEYIHLHAADSEGASEEEMSCGDLNKASSLASG